MENRRDIINRIAHEQAKERGLRAVRLRKAGETWAAIGLLLGVTRQRAQALAKAHAKQGEI
jgi:predicted transcriptional regulator